MEKFQAGADLVHLISGMIFTGPHLMGEIAGAWARESQGGALPIASGRISG